MTAWRKRGVNDRASKVSCAAGWPCAGNGIMQLRPAFTHLAAVSLLCAAMAGCGRKSGHETQPPDQARIAISDTISLFAYNVENLFDLVYDGAEYDEYIPNQCGWTEAMMNVKLRSIASVIAAVNADIAVLCEIENARALAALIAMLREERCRYGYWAIDTVDHQTAVRPAILARYPLVDVKTIPVAAEGEQGGARAMLEADCRIGGAALKLFAVHWPSKNKPESYRVASARALAQRIAALPPETDYVIAGDFNANYDECETMRMSKLDDTRGVSSVNHILKTVSSAPGAAPVYVREADVARLGAGWHFDPWVELPPAARCSYVYQARAETPDHILLSAGLFDSSGFSYADNSFRVFTWSGRLLNDGVPLRWQMKFRGKKRYHLGMGYSDHLPLVATFRFGAFAAQPDRSMEDAPTAHAPRARSSTIAGWIPCNRTVRVVKEALDRGNCVRIEGHAPKATLQALRRVVTVTPGASRIALPLRGSGKIGVRMRARDGDWWYYGPPGFVAKRSIRYAAFAAESWLTAKLSLAPLGNAQEVEMEIRIGKGDEYRFWIGVPEAK